MKRSHRLFRFADAIRFRPVSAFFTVAIFCISMAAAKDTISDYFQRLAAPSFLEVPASQLLRHTKGNKLDVVDTKNGFLFIQGDGAQVSLEAALFRYSDGHPLIAVSYGELEVADFINIEFFLEKDGKIIPARQIAFPFPTNGGKLRFDLPRVGRTIIVKNPQGKTVAKITWNGASFVKEK